MEFRNPTVEEKQAVESIWSYCFEPKGDPFFEFYFSQCYSAEDTLIGIDTTVHGVDQVLATVHLRPYEISVRNKTMPMAYIVGVATHPTARRSGVGKEILVASLAELRRKGHGLNILMPSMAGFYQPYGWELYCHQWIRRMPLEKLRPLADRTLAFKLIETSDEWPILQSVYEKYTAPLSGYAVRSETHWRRLLESLYVEHVHIVVAYDQGKPVGYMFYRLGEPEIMVSEIVYTTRQAQRALLGYIYNHRSQGESIRWNEGLCDQGYTFYPDGKEGNAVFPFMMSRIVDVETAIQQVPLQGIWHEKITFDLVVDDPLVEWNRGIFQINYEQGHIQVRRKHNSSPKEPSLQAHISVGALSLLLMGRMTARELVFEGKLEGHTEVIAFLETLYPKQKNYINEWY